MTPRVLDALDTPRWHRVFLLVVALAVFVPAVLAALWRPLWYDELFTLYVASEPSFASTLGALLAGADTNPPVDYLVRHASIALFGSSPEALRWPSAAVFIAGLFAIYAYVRRRAPFLASAAAFLMPIGTAAVYFSYEARAYALLFASAPIALWAWQRAADEPRRPARLAVLLAALCLGPYSHYYGALNFLPVAAGEAWRSYRQRRVDSHVAGTIGAACVLMVGLLPFARAAEGMRGRFWAAGFRASDLPFYYRGFLEYGGRTVVAVIGVSILLALAGCIRMKRADWPKIPGYEIVAAFVLALAPFTAFLLASLGTGALTTKYAIALVPGVAILLGYLLACAEVRLRGLVAILVAALMALTLRQHVESAMSYRGTEPVDATIVQALRESTLPVAFDSPHQFLEYVHYEPGLAARFYYPMDPATAVAVRGFDNDERALRGLARIRPLNILDYHAFVARNEPFLVVYTDAFWPGLVKALRRDGYCLVQVSRSAKTALLQAFPGCRPSGS